MSFSLPALPPALVQETPLLRLKSPHYCRTAPRQIPQEGIATSYIYNIPTSLQFVCRVMITTRMQSHTKISKSTVETKKTLALPRWAQIVSNIFPGKRALCRAEALLVHSLITIFAKITEGDPLWTRHTGQV